MPVIAYKTLTITFFYAQGRRIVCEECGDPFSFITGGIESGSTTGLPLVSSDNRMREDAFRGALRALKKTANKHNVGEAACPHCRMYQRWMIAHSKNESMGCGAVIGLGLLGVVPWLVNLFAGWSDQHLAILVGGGVVGLIGGIVLGRMGSLSSDPISEPDARSMADEELQEHLEACEEREFDPFLAWWMMVGNKPNDKQAPVSLGMDDLTDNPLLLPHELTTDHVFEQI